MADLDKVLKGLECCDKKYPRNAWCKYCPYEPDCCHDSTCDLLIHDAISVIKEQQAEIEQLTKTADGTWIQKADATGHEYSMCSACETVINTPDGCGGYNKLDMTGAKYCPNCGAKMD